MCKGLPASGKSTWARQQVEKGKGEVKRVNKDDLRLMLDNGKWSKFNEEFICDVRDAIIQTAVSKGKTIIVDDTNLDPKHETHIRAIFGGFLIDMQEFKLDVETCIERDSKRENPVGEIVIRRMYDQYIRPKKVAYKPDNVNPRAVIFDIDGTLAQMKDRGPYDWKRVGEDTLNIMVAAQYHIFRNAGYKIIIFSGRDSCCRKETEKWLKENDIIPDHLDMRKRGDMRKDNIVKKEMFDKIKDEYSVELVFDDRNSVVKMWRDLGLTVFQVAEGNF